MNKDFEIWFAKEYPLPPTIERGPIGRYFKEGCKEAYIAGSARLQAENERLKEEIAQLKTQLLPNELEQNMIED